MKSRRYRKKAASGVAKRRAMAAKLAKTERRNGESGGGSHRGGNNQSAGKKKTERKRQKYQRMKSAAWRQTNEISVSQAAKASQSAARKISGMKPKMGERGGNLEMAWRRKECRKLGENNEGGISGGVAAKYRRNGGESAKVISKK
jgi:hypothetical protein